MSSSTQTALKPFPVKKALLIDADEPTRAYLANILNPGEWSIRHAPDHQTALELARGTHFDLILTSEKTSGRDDIELMREHAFSYFSKPFSLDALAEMVLLATEAPCWDDGIEVVSATPEWIRLMVRSDRQTADRLV